MDKRQSFEAKLVRPSGVGTWTYVDIPFDVATAYGAAGQVKVKGTVNGAAFRGSLMPHGDGRHYLVVNAALRAKACVSAGDSAKVVVEPDTAPREVTLAADTRKALAENSKAANAFASMAYSHQKAYVDWIEGAKKPETRARRIASAIERLENGQGPLK